MNDRYSFVLLGLVVAILQCGAQSFAHDSRPLFIEITEAEHGAVRMSWKAPLSVGAYAAPTIRLNEPCRPTHSLAPSHSLQGLKTYDCPAGLAETGISIAYRGYNPSISTLVRIEYASGQTHTTILEPAVTEWRIPARNTFYSVAKDYFIVGVQHIGGGVDHLLFLASLIYIARTPRRILVTVTGFTFAHSLTIFLVALDIVRISPPAVEVVIALSIVFLASEIARNERETLTWRRPILVAGGFGLIHGAGFVSALGEIGLPEIEKINALIFFNLGVEAGQLAVVSVAAAAYWTVRSLLPFMLPNNHKASYRFVFGYSLGILSAYWLLERFMGALL